MWVFGLLYCCCVILFIFGLFLLFVDVDVFWYVFSVVVNNVSEIVLCVFVSIWFFLIDILCRKLVNNNVWVVWIFMDIK